jgi:hypothetical protein
MEQQKPPPIFPEKCLRFFCSSKYLEEILGDLEEIYHEK